MCIAIPKRIIRVENNIAVVSVEDGELEIDISLVSAKVGDYVIIQSGYAINVMSEKEARESLDLWETIKEKDSKSTKS